MIRPISLAPLIPKSIILIFNVLKSKIKPDLNEGEEMAKFILMLSAFVSLMVMACTAPVAQEPSTEGNESLIFTVFRSPT